MGIDVRDVNAIRSFATELDGFQRKTKSQLAGIDARAKGLGQKWKDEHYRRWLKQFDKSKEEIERFLQASKKYSRYLQEAAGELEKAERKLRGG